MIHIFLSFVIMKNNLSTQTTLLYLTLIAHLLQPSLSMERHLQGQVNQTLHDNPELKLFKHLFAKYSKEVRPILKADDTVPVVLDLAYSLLVNMDEKNQILVSNLWVRMIWTDPWLVWNKKEFGGIISLNVDPSLVWKPDIILYNNVQTGTSGEMYLFNTKITVWANGTVRWLAPVQVMSECKIDTTNFPLDEQHCQLKFGSWTYNGLQLNLTIPRDSADLSFYTSNGEWEMIGAKAVRNTNYFNCCPEPYYTVTYTIHIRRRALFYLMNLILPCVLLTLLSAVTFRFPPESGERVSLTITILLGMTVFMLIFINSIPASSEVVPLIGKYFASSLMLIATSLIGTCVTLTLYHRNPSIQPSGRLQHLVFRILAPGFGIKPPKGLEREAEIKLFKKENSYIADDAPLIGNGRPGHTIRFERKEEVNLGLNKLISAARLCHSFPNNLPEKTKNNCACRHIDKILIEMKRNSRRHESIQDSEKLKSKRREEWHFIAYVIDRLFFYTFIFVFVSFTLIIFLMSPLAAHSN